MILSMLYMIDSADFVFLHKQSGLTRGNISTHISRLEEEKYIQVEKEFMDKKPRTVYRITRDGRRALEKYRHKMNKVRSELE